MDINSLDNIEIQLCDIASESVVDGTGIRYTIFVQGCPHNCKGCHNPSSHAFTGGHVRSLGFIAKEILKNPLLDGITFSGGEPFYYPKECGVLAEFLQKNNLNVWCYSGYTYEELLDMAKTNNDTKNFLDNIDVLVDGKFIENQKNLMLKFRGSENQRIINLKKMRETSTQNIEILF